VKIVTFDAETYYDREYSLSKITTEDYVRSPQFELIGFAIKTNAGPTQWVPKPECEAFIKSFDWSDAMVVCQNTAFDGAILDWHYGVKPQVWADILGMSRALYPHDKAHRLEVQAERMGVGVKGHEVMNAIGKRYADFYDAELARYAAYCINDVELTYDIFMKYMSMGFPKQELKLIDLTLRMFIEPVLELDPALLRDHLEAVKEAKQALLETVRDNMLEVKPTIVTTVPRLFERIYSRVIKQVDSGSPIKKKIFRWAIAVGKRHARARRRGRISPLLAAQHAIADKLVYSKLRERTGGRMKFFVSGGAALASEFGEFFEAVGLKIIEGYGLTETSPVISCNRVDNYKWGAVGMPIPGVEVRIAEDGEILSRGPNTMKGYWNNPQATAEVIDKDGWLHTGDIGNVDAEGFIHITDRKKHLFVSSGGKNIAPQPIENLFLSSKYIEQFMLIGDRRMYLTALIVPDFDALKEYADSNNLPYKDEVELARHPKVNNLIETEINHIQRDLANFERVRRFTLLDRQFTIEDGELTPTQKVRRKAIEERYRSIIDGMYEGIT